MPHKDRATQRDYAKEYHQRNKAKHNEYNKTYQKQHPRQRNNYLKGYRKGIKIAAFEAYGGCVCACCGETHLEFLSIDHVDGGGAEHRRQLGKNHGPGARFYAWLKNQGFPPGYRVLCMNCNASIGWYGYCPHGKAEGILSRTQQQPAAQLALFPNGNLS